MYARDCIVCVLLFSNPSLRTSRIIAVLDETDNCASMPRNSYTSSAAAIQLDSNKAPRTKQTKNTTNCNSRSVLYPTQAYTCRQCYCSAHIINQCQKKDNVLHSIHVQEITYNYTVSSQVSSTVCKCSGSLWLTELCEHPVDRHTLAPPRHDTHAHTRTPMTLTLGGEALANIGTAH